MDLEKPDLGFPPGLPFSVGARILQIGFLDHPIVCALVENRKADARKALEAKKTGVGVGPRQQGR